MPPTGGRCELEGLTAALMAVALAGLGLWTLVRRRNVIWKLLGLNVASGGSILFLVGVAHRPDARPPILDMGPGPAADPLPQALVLPLLHILQMLQLLS